MALAYRLEDSSPFTVDDDVRPDRIDAVRFMQVSACMPARRVM